MLFGGCGTSVSRVKDIPFFCDWSPYHYGGFKVLMVKFQPIFVVWTPISSREVSWSLLDSWCLVFVMSDKKTCMQWRRRWDHTCVPATTFQYDPKHQTVSHTELTKGRLSKHQSARRVYVAFLATRGMIFHEKLMIYHIRISMRK